MSRSLDGAEILILGGTGSLGQRLFHRILSGELGEPESITVFSRDEAKQHYMRLEFLQLASATDDVIYRESVQRVRFCIGDVRNYSEVKRNVDRADVIFHAAALKQVPTCEYFGAAAVDTNINGAINLGRALRDGDRAEKSVIGISTDKACKPVNVMGMTKALQERILIQSNIDSPWARAVNVRYGNVMASRGSVIPFFIDVIRAGKPLPITDERMTRFLMTLDQSVDLIFNAYLYANPGETYLPLVPSAKVVDIGRAVALNPAYPLQLTGIRPGEKVHEILVSEEEVAHSELRGENVVVLPILPELRVRESAREPLPFDGEYSSAVDNLSFESVVDLLTTYGLTAETAPVVAGEVNR
jgi:FlaA1/EpsC-like NDP-sugar epimerase